MESTYGILHFVGIICRLKVLDFTAQNENKFMDKL